MCQADIEVNHVQQGEDSRTPDPSLLTAYPIALYTATLVAYIIYAVNQDPFFLQSRGGSKKPTLRPLSPPPSDFSLAGPKDILKFIEYTANRIIHAELDPKTAYALGYLADCALRAYNGGPLAERLDRIEQLLKAECDIPVGRSEYMGVEFRDTPDQADEDVDHGPQDELSEPLAEETAPEAEQVRALHTKRRAA